MLYRDPTLVEPPVPSFWERFKTTRVYHALKILNNSEVMFATRILVAVLTVFAGILLIVSIILNDISNIEAARCNINVPTNAQHWVRSVLHDAPRHLQPTGQNGYDIFIPGQVVPLTITCGCKVNDNCRVVH